jgi:hypothetical protein
MIISSIFILFGISALLGILYYKYKMENNDIAKFGYFIILLLTLNYSIYSWFKYFLGI